MANESSSYLADAQEHLQLLKAHEGGQQDGLCCPKCRQSSVSVWFTHPLGNEYRTWFLFENCDFSMRAQNIGKPAHYSKERDRTGIGKESLKTVPDREDQP